MFVYYFMLILSEVFEFKNLKPLIINFRLERENISTGFFKIYPETKIHFNIDIVSKKKNKKFFNTTLDSLEEKHFSFSNKDIEDLQVVITPQTLPTSPSQSKIYMKYESKLNTFNKEVAMKSQIEPAVFALDKLLQKLISVTDTSKKASQETTELGKEHKRMFVVVVFLSFISLVAYTIFNIIQLTLMKKYLYEKKYL